MACSHLATRVCSILSVCQRYDSSEGLHRLWDLFLALVSGDERFIDRANQIEILSEDIGIFTCNDGCMVYTTRTLSSHTALNVNLCIPARPISDRHLIYRFLEVFTALDKMVVNLAPLCTHVPALMLPRHGLVIPSRFVEMRQELQLVTIDATSGHMVHNGRRHAYALRIAADAGNVSERIRHLRPLGRFNAMADDDELFWFRPTGDECIVITTNPRYRLPAQMQLGRCSLRSISREYRSLALSLCQPVDDNVAVEAVGRTAIPPWVWIHLVHAILAHCTMSDTLVRSIGTHPHATGMATTDTDVRLCVELCAIDHGSLRPSRTLFRIAVVSTTRPQWCTWVASSCTILKMLQQLDDADVQLVCRHSTEMRQALHRALCCCTWIDDVWLRRAQFVHAIDGTATPSTIRRRLQRRMQQRSALVTPAPPVPASPTEDDTETVDVTAAFACLDTTAAPSEEHNHIALAARMASELAIDVTLIGSGIFFAARDMDVVIRWSPKVSLSDAYEAVAAATGWSLVNVVDGEHTAILSGTFDGVPVDAQVWRGAPAATRAEMRTAAAIAMSNRLEHETDTYVQRCIRLLHRWGDVALIKGHLLCRLPGIAITILAIAFGRRDGHGYGDSADDALLRRLLVRFDMRLRGVPIVSIDDDDDDTEHDQNGKLLWGTWEGSPRGRRLRWRPSSFFTPDDIGSDHFVSLLRQAGLDRSPSVSMLMLY